VLPGVGVHFLYNPLRFFLLSLYCPQHHAAIQILPEEVAAVEAAVEQHPKAHNYRVSVKHDRIEIYERVGPDLDDLIARFGKKMPLTTGQVERLRESQERSAQFTPVMRFILVNAERRTFCAERWCYLGSVDDWIDVGPMGSVDDLARRLIPKLGTDQLFELF
jgi:hypothetical protein